MDASDRVLRLVPLLQCFEYNKTYQHNYYENLQLTLTEEMENSSTVVRTTMLGMTGKHVDR